MRDSTNETPGVGYYVRVTANDMAPRFKAGDVAMIDPDAPPAVDDDVLIEFAAGGKAQRRLAAQSDRTLTLATYDGSPPAEYARREIAAMHCVVARTTPSRAKPEGDHA
jgi:phage repressor protein C with HTH and peptisase S24 domain